MNPQPTRRKGPELPRARIVVLVNGSRVLGIGEAKLKKRSENDIVPDYNPCAVIPARSLREAREMVKVMRFFQQSEGEQVAAMRDDVIELIRDQERRSDEGWEPGVGDLADEYIRAVLARIQKGAKP